MCSAALVAALGAAGATGHAESTPAQYSATYWWQASGLSCFTHTSAVQGLGPPTAGRLT